MPTAKDIRVEPISAQSARDLVKRVHYSGKVTANSQLHFGVFLNGRLEGAMQFGPSLDKRKTQSLVRDTGWNSFLELNRMAFSDNLPRNSESRALGIALRTIKKAYPHIEWVISFADGTQCGDGTIYHASGFILTGINKNKTIWGAPDGQVYTDLSLRTNPGSLDKAVKTICAGTASDSRRPESAPLLGELNLPQTGASSMRPFIAAGFKPLPGYQLRYVYFLNPEARKRLTVPEIPFSKIEEMGAGMYKGKQVTRGKGQELENPSSLGGSTPTPALHESDSRKVA